MTDVPMYTAEFRRIPRVSIQHADLVARLATHRRLADVPVEELEWLAAHGELRRYEAQVDPLVAQGEPIAEFFIALSGRFSFYVDRGSGHRKVTEWRGGDFMGVLPYSRLTHSPGNAITEEDADVFAIPRAHLAEMIRACPAVTTACVHVMLDRARVFNASELQDEKMISLGRLSAGLAHELNNPASAAARSARMLTEAVVDADHASHELGALGLSDAQMKAIEAVRDACLASETLAPMSAMERADREDAITDWLDAHGASQDCAMPLSETAVTLATLDALAAVVDQRSLNVALHWIGAGCTVRTLSRDVEKAATRIHELVSAVKRFTHMDQPLVPEPQPVEQGLRDTVTMLSSKARQKSIGVKFDISPELPRARVSAEINQVWTNLIDNALDAAPEDGTVVVTAAFEAPWVVVRVRDNGSGVPPDIAARIFDPFFTTKPVGQGTGLGLDIVHRVLRQWGGEIDFKSEPGRTEFIVRLPAEGS